MQKKNLSSILIVGCGHSLSQDVFEDKYNISGNNFNIIESGCHMHPNCWCIDIIENYCSIFPGINDLQQWQKIKADDCVDIIKKFLEFYKEKFDVVVLEMINRKNIYKQLNFVDINSGPVQIEESLLSIACYPGKMVYG